jgi:hypothetical protein
LDEETVKKSPKPKSHKPPEKTIGARLRKSHGAHKVFSRRSASFAKGGLPFAKQCAASLGR